MEIINAMALQKLTTSAPEKAKEPRGPAVKDKEFHV
jgi:hypothetical protein